MNPPNIQTTGDFSLIRPVQPHFVNPDCTDVLEDIPLTSKKEIHAKALWKIIADHQAKTLAPLAEKKGFIARAWRQISAFICWISRTKVKVLPAEFRQQFAMLLFRTRDAELLSQTQPLDISFSTALEAYIHAITSYKDALASIEPEQLEALKRCIEYSKSIEAAQKLSASSRHSHINRLTQVMAEQIKHLSPNQCIYIPGGLIEYANLAGIIPESKLLLLKNKELKTTHMLFEIHKHPAKEGKILFRLFNYSDSLNNTSVDSTLNQIIPQLVPETSGLNRLKKQLNTPSSPAATEYELELKVLIEHLSMLLEVQTAPSFSYNRRWFEWIWHVRSLLKPFSLEDHSAYKLDQFFNRIRPCIIQSNTNHEPIKVRLRPSTNPVKLFKVFGKAIDEPERKVRQLLQKTSLFLEILEDAKPKMAQDPKLTKWIRDNAINLFQTYKNYFGNNQLDYTGEQQWIVNHFAQIVNELESITNAQRKPFQLPLSPQQQQTLPSKFAHPIVFEGKPTPLKTFQALTQPSASYLEPLPTISFLPKDYKTCFDRFENWITICIDLSKMKQLDSLHLVLESIFFDLAMADKNNFWSSIPQEDCEEWSRRLKLLCMFVAQVQFCLGRSGPFPRQILNLLNLLRRCQSLAYINYPKTCFKGYALQMDAFRDILRDPYLDLENEGHKIKAVIDEIESGGSCLVRLNDPSENKRQAENDRAFFDHYRKEHSLSVDVPLEEDFGSGGNLASQIVDLRCMRALTRGLMEKYRCFGNLSLWTMTKNSIKTSIAFLRRQIKDLDKDLLLRIFDEIDHHLKRSALPFTMVKNRFFLHPKATIKIKECDLDFFDCDQPIYARFGAHPLSQYKKNGQEVPKAIESKVIEAAVSNSEAKLINEEGFELTADEQHRYFPTGECHSESFIANNHEVELGWPADLWAEFKLMQTSPLETRIPNTFAFLCRNAPLFDYSHDGLAVQRVFDLNLFRNNALYHYLTARPEQALILIKQISMIFTNMHATNNFQGLFFILTLVMKSLSIMQCIPSIDLTNLKNIKNEQLKILESCLADEKLKESTSLKRLIHYIHLLYVAEKFDHHFNEQLTHSLYRPLALLKSYFIIQSIPQPLCERNNSYDDKIAFLMHHLFPYCSKELENESIRNKFLNELIPSEESPNHPWNLDGPLCFSKGPLCIDLIQGLLYRDGVAKTYLPEIIINELSTFASLDWKIIHDTLCKAQPIEKEGKNGHLYEFIYQQQMYRFVLLPGQETYIYKQVAHSGMDTEWYELRRNISLIDKHTDDLYLPYDSFFSSKEKELHEIALKHQERSLPQEFTRHFFWSSNNGCKFIVENKKGEKLFEGECEIVPIKKSKNSATFTVVKINRAHQFADNEYQILLNPWKQPEYSRFLALGKPTQIVASGKNNKVERIQYLQYPLEYFWDYHQSCWTSKNFSGYTLSTQPIEALLNNSSQKKPYIFYFDRLFTDYHILEHRHKPPLLLLAAGELHHSSTQQDDYTTKYNRKKISIKREDNGSIPLYCYEIDPIEGPKAKTQEESLYLAYIFYVQSKHDLALFYLEKSKNIKPGKSIECDRIIKLFEKWPVNSTIGYRILLKLQMLILKQQQFNNKNQKNKEVKQLQKILKLLAEYAQHNEKNPITSNLKFSFQEHSELFFYLTSMRDKVEIIYQQTQNLLDSFGKFDIYSISKTFENLKEQIAENQKSVLDEISKLDKEIAILKKSIALTSPPKYTPSEILQTPLPLFPEFKCYLTSDTKLEQNYQLKKNIENFAAAINSLTTLIAPDSEDALTIELADDLIADIDIAVKQQNASITVVDSSANIKEIECLLKQRLALFEKQSLQAKQKILKSLNNPQLPTVDIALMTLRECRNTNESIFRRILLACESDDWHEFIKEKLIDKGSIKSIKSNVQDYLICKTTLHQHRKALTCIYDSQEANPTFFSRLGEILASKRFYDPYKDPNRFHLLMLEDQQQVIIRQSQLETYNLNQCYFNLFIHQPLGSGKTSVERNLNARIHADGFHLAGIATDENLIGQHHALLQDTTLEAYGQLAYRFEFDRSSDSSSYGLRIILRNLLKIIAERGRLDFTKRDILNFRHLPLQKLRELAEKIRPEEHIHEELDLIYEILDIFKNRLVVGTDELDKIANPSIEHNWGIGSVPIKLDVNKCKAALLLMQWTLQDQAFASYFNKGIQYNLKDPEEYISMLSSRAGIHFNIPKKNNFFGTKIKSANSDIIRFQSLLEERSLNDTTILHVYSLLQSVVRASLMQRNGVRYIRSQDLFSVKPAERNGKCNENSERRSEEELIWYTCLNYMNTHAQKQGQGGVLPQQIAFLVRHLKHKSNLQRLDALKTIKNHSPFHATIAEQKFLKDFNLHLNRVTEKDFVTIANTINSTPSLLVNFIFQYVFPLTEISPKQFTGNTQHFVNMFNQFYGSSGTPNTYPSFPDKILKLNSKDLPLAKKPGVEGAVLLALLKDYEDADLIAYEDNDQVHLQIGRVLEQAGETGAMFIDLAPVFPGSTASAIVDKLSGLIPQTKFRYITHDDKVVIKDIKTGTIETANASLDLRSVTTILAKDQERGTHLDLADDAIGVLTINKTTTLPEFQQAIMRLRKLGRGQKVKLLIEKDSYAALDDLSNIFKIPETHFKTLKSSKIVNLILLLMKNESQSLKQLRYKAERQKILAITECSLYNAMRELREREARSYLWEACSPIFEQPTQMRIETSRDLSKLKQIRLQTDAPAQLQLIANNECQKIDAIIKLIDNMPAEANTKCKVREFLIEGKKALLAKTSTFKDINKYLPSHVDENQHHLGTEQLVEREQDNFQEQEQLQEQLTIFTKNIETFIPKPWVDLDVHSIQDLMDKVESASTAGNPILALNSTNSSFPDSKRASYTFYDNNIYITKNLHPLNQMFLFRIVLIVDRHKKSRDAVTCIAGTLKDFDHIFYKLDQQSREDEKFDYYMYNLWTDELEGCHPEWHQYNFDIQKALARAIVQLKHAAGELFLIQSEDPNAPDYFKQKTAFLDWLHDLSIQNIQHSEWYLINYLHSMRPSNYASYSQSPLSHLYRLATSLHK